MVANYAGGSIAVYALRPDRSLGERTAFVQHTGAGFNPKRQDRPHARSIRVDPTNKFVLAADLGLDKVLVYRLDAKTGALEPNAPPVALVTPGSGPRHLVFDPHGRRAYLINEIASSILERNIAKSGVLRLETAGKAACHSGFCNIIREC